MSKFLFVFTFALTLPLGANAIDRVLILQSAEIGHWWSEEELAGIRQAFADHPNYQLHLERLDLFQFNQPEYERSLVQFLRGKYGPLAAEFRGVVVTDMDALRFFIGPLSPLLKNLPLTFSGVREPIPEFVFQSGRRYGGVIQYLGHRETVQAALRLQPYTRRIFVVADATQDAQSNVYGLRQIEHEFPVEFHYIGTGTFEETARVLKSLGPGDIVLRFRAYVDKAGHTMNVDQSMEFLRANTHVPIYSFWEGLLGRGIVGGRLISGVTQGEQAARLLIDMMEGRELKAGRLIHADTGRYMFDDQMLRRFGLDRNRLPPESILINEPDTFYKHYYRQIWAFTVLVSALLALVAGLLWINSKLRTARETLLAAKRAAEDASQMKSRFLANMSHEIRTPLGAVLGFAELLTASDLSPAQRNELIEKIKRHGVILTNVVNDILDFSRAESGRLQIERIKIDLRELLSDVLSAPTLIAKEKGLRLGISSEGPIPRFIMSDPTRLKQILSNLIGNAIKFTNQGSVECHIKFQPTPLQATSPETKNRIIFFVRDTGRGLSEKEAAGLFMPFIQADTSTTRKYGGTGLGLALARDLARALGGDVRLIDYAEGRGCTFEASIEAGACGGEWTLHDVADLEAVTAASPSTSTLPTTQLTGLKVLLAEDSADNQLFVSRFLRKAGAEVDIVENGAEAIEAALNGDHDLILMDIQMPILDGIEATKELRQKGYRKPIVALTAHALADQRQRTHDAGCNYHLTKPVNRDELMQTVARLTGGDHGEGP